MGKNWSSSIEDIDDRLGNLHSDRNEFLLNALSNLPQIIFSFYCKLDCAITDCNKSDERVTRLSQAGLV